MRTNHRPGPVNTIGEARSVCANSGRVEPVDANLVPGPVNTNLVPGPVNTNLVPEPVNTNWGPEPGLGAKQRAGGREIQIPLINRFLTSAFVLIGQMV